MTLAYSTPATALPDIYCPRPAEILEARALTDHEMFFRFRSRDATHMTWMPGQFMEVSVPLHGEAPISIASSPTRGEPNTFEMVVRRVGGLTSALHRLSAGSMVGIRGPYGTHFPVDDAMRGEDVLFICGGIGMVPVRSAIHYVLDNRRDYGHVTVLYGARRPHDLLFTDELYFWKQSDHVQLLDTVDAGDVDWNGHVGVITSLFDKITINPRRTIAVVCGPPIMYRFVLRELRKLRLPAERVYVSLERHMKCGVGKCGHCQVNGLYTCRDGPVFRYTDIAAVPEAI